MIDKAIALLSDLIKNRCINDGTPNSGNEIKSALTLKYFFKTYGIESEVLESRPGRANIIVRIPGKEPTAPSLMYMGHLDVVPVNIDNWSCNPFNGEIRGGYIWGRGAIDMLNIIATAAVAFAELVKKNGNLLGDFIFLAVADEEASGRFGSRWLVENHWEKVKTDYLITEQGGFFINNKRDTGISISVGEKGLAWTKISTKGTSGHGSLPFLADNAVEKIATAVNKIISYPIKLTISKTLKRMIKKMNFTPIQKQLLSHPYFFNNAIKKLKTNQPGLSALLHAISRMTFSPNFIQGGNKINIIPDTGTLDIDCRILPGQTIEDVISEISNALGSQQNDYNIEIIDFFPASISSSNSPLYNAIIEILSTIYPGTPNIPSLFSGVTDARFWRMRGTIAYGFALYDNEFTIDEFIKMLHGNDERISIKSLEHTLNFFYQLPEIFYRMTEHQP